MIWNEARIPIQRSPVAPELNDRVRTGNGVRPELTAVERSGSRVGPTDAPVLRVEPDSNPSGSEKFSKWTRRPAASIRVDGGGPDEPSVAGPSHRAMAEIVDLENHVHRFDHAGKQGPVCGDLATVAVTALDLEDFDLAELDADGQGETILDLRRDKRRQLTLLLLEEGGPIEIAGRSIALDFMDPRLRRETGTGCEQYNNKQERNFSHFELP